MMFRFPQILITVCLLHFSLSSCGFQVIYKPRDKNVEISHIEELAAIRIEKDRSLLGQKMKNNLYDALNPSNDKVEAKYFLILKTSDEISPTYITTTGASGRNRVTLSVNYTLKSLKNAVVISTGSTSISDNYNVTTNRYATHQAENYVRNNLTTIAAQNIRNSIVNDFVEARRECVEVKSKPKDEIENNLKLKCEALK